MFKDAKPISQYYDAGRKAGKTYIEMQKRLKVIERYQAEYGDWTLYEDDEGNRWEDYFSIGD